MIRVFSFFLLLFAGSLWANETITLNLKWSHQFQFAGYYAALEQGYYAEEGLEVVLKPWDSQDASIYDQVSREGVGSYGAGDITLLKKHAEGRPLVLLSNIFQHSPLVLTTLRSSGITMPEELVGKKIMVNEDLDRFYIEALLMATGVSPEKVTFVRHTYDKNDLLQGRVDAMTVYRSDQPFWFRKQGVDVNIIDPRSYGIDFYGDNIFTNEVELRTHPGRAARFVRASLKGWEYALEHPEAIIDLLIRKYGVTMDKSQLQDEAKEVARHIRADMIPLGSVDPERYRKIAVIYQSLGIPVDEEMLGHFFLDNWDSHYVRLTHAERQWLTAHPVIRVGVDRDWAPFEYADSGGVLRGMASEYIDLLEKRLGVTFHPDTGLNWQDTLDAVKAHRLDMFSCVAKTPERQAYVDFTTPYLSFPMVIIARDDVSTVVDLDTLKNKKVAVVRGYYSYEMLARNHPEISLLEVDDLVSGLRAVSEGRVDAYAGNLASISYSMKKSGINNLKVVGHTPYFFELGMAVRKDWPEFQAILQKALDSITDKERDAIYRRWVSLRTVEEVDYTLLYQIIGGGIALVGLIFFWSMRMRREIQWRKSMESALQESEQRFRLLSDLSEEMMFIIEDGHIVDVNLAVEKKTALEKAAILGRTLLSFVPVLQRETVANQLNRRSEAPYETEIIGEGKIPFPVMVKTKIIRRENREILVTLLTDISLQKKQRNALESMVQQRSSELITTNEELMQRVRQLNHANRLTRLAFWEWEVDTDRFTVVHDPLNILGMGAKGWQGSTTSVEEWVAEDDREMFEKVIQEAKEGDRRDFDLSLRWSNNRETYLHIYAEMLDEYPRRIVGVAQDVTESRRREKEQQEQERMLIQQSKMAAMGEMIGAIAHQWKQPISALSLVLQDIRDAYEYGQLDKKYLDTSIDMGQTQLEFMSQTIDDFRNFFKPAIKQDLFDVSDETRKVVALVAAQLRKDHIHMSITLPQMALMARGYPSEFKQVVLNLVKNAKEAILTRVQNGQLAREEGLIRITGDVKEGTVLLMIEDNGGGLSETALRRLFTPYFSTKGEQGTGIGLSLSRSIMEKIGGNIEARNGEAGACFTITLPLDHGVKDDNDR